MYIIEPERKIEVSDKVDVVVTGGGPSGFAAAYTAAKCGAKCILTEQLGNIGGISTSGLMSHWTGTCDSALYREILRRSAEAREGAEHGKIINTINPEELKTIYLEMLSEVGCEVRLYTSARAAVRDGRRVSGVITEGKEGRRAILAGCVVDASGDGDIAADAGVPFCLGREEDGKMQPATIMFKVGGVDTDRAVYLGSFESKYKTPKGELQELAREKLPFPAGHVLLYRSTLPGIVTCNMTNCTDVDGTDSRSLTRATGVCRSQMKKIVEFLREYVPGYEHCFIISSASLIGVRETRHFKGLYTLTGDDIYSAKVFDDWVVKGAYFNFDVHNLTGAGLDKTGVQAKFGQKQGYTIPYRCLVPENMDGILLCGRNISGTHMAHSNFRAMPICVAIGEAAGAAAAESVRLGVTQRELDPAVVRAALIHASET